MKNNKGNFNKDDDRLRNYSQVLSLNRLSDEDSQIASGITVGGDKDELGKDIEDDDKA